MKPLKYLFISSMLFVATSCGNSWLDLEPSTSVDTETSIKILSEWHLQYDAEFGCLLRTPGILWRCDG